MESKCDSDARLERFSEEEVLALAAEADREPCWPARARQLAAAVRWLLTALRRAKAAQLLPGSVPVPSCPCCGAAGDKISLVWRCHGCGDSFSATHEFGQYLRAAWPYYGHQHLERTGGMWALRELGERIHLLKRPPAEEMRMAMLVEEAQREFMAPRKGGPEVEAPAALTDEGEPQDGLAAVEARVAALEARLGTRAEFLSSGKGGAGAT